MYNGLLMYIVRVTPYFNSKVYKTLIKVYLCACSKPKGGI